MTITIKRTILIMMIVLPYLYGEYSYRQHLGTAPMQCVKVWEEERCSKGRNCHYENYGLMLFNNGTTSTFVGTYNIGSTYQTEKTWAFIEHNIQKEPKQLAIIAQSYRFIANALLLLFGIVGTSMLAISTFIWLTFKTRYKNPFSFWVLEFNTLALTSYEQRIFMDENPFWFYKEEH